MARGLKNARFHSATRRFMRFYNAVTAGDYEQLGFTIGRRVFTDSTAKMGLEGAAQLTPN
jgi:hypothetical protein